MKLLYLLLLSFFFFCLDNPANARQLQLSNDAQISLITIYPGEAPEELFGHSAVRVNDPLNNVDISYNYGTFEFDAFFLARFVYGDLQYFLSEAYFESTVNHYRDRQRPMIEQVLNLTTEQKQNLFDFLRENARPENRYYQYDFLFDNCSTRIRDAVEYVFGADVQFETDSSSELTFRDMIHQYVDYRPFIHLGIDLLLGSNIDRNATTREQMFLPDYLMYEFEHALILIDGEQQPLVSTTETILQIEDYEIEQRLPWASILNWGLFLIGAVITYKTARDGKSFEPWFDLPLFTLAGLIGLLITFLWFFSLHNETVNNLNLLWALPTHLFLIPLLYRRILPGFPLTVYLIFIAVICLTILLGWRLWAQELHPAIFPILLLLSVRSGGIIYTTWGKRRLASETSQNTNQNR